MEKKLIVQIRDFSRRDAWARAAPVNPWGAMFKNGHHRVKPDIGHFRKTAVIELYAYLFMQLHGNKAWLWNCSCT